MLLPAPSWPTPPRRATWPRTASKASSAADDAAFERESNLWDKSRQTNTAAAYMTYMTQYPSGIFFDLAQARLDRVEKPVATPRFRVDDALANDTATVRFRIGDVYEYDARRSDRPSSRQNRRWQVTSIDDDVVKMNAGGRTFDLLGNIQSRNQKAWRDAQFLPAYYQAGKRWRLRAQIETDKREDIVSLDAHISARKRITVTAGEFDVYRIEIAGLGKDGSRYAWTFWMNPNYGMLIRSTESRHNAKARLSWVEQSELVKLQAERG